MKNSNVTVVILIDALRHDMIGKNTPFLLSMCQNGVIGKLEPPLSYVLHPVWFAGLNPDSSDKFLSYVYSPESVPYKRIQFVSLLERNHFPNFITGFARHHLIGSMHGSAPFIPKDLLRYFNIQETLCPWDEQYLLGVPTLFYFLRKKNQQWLFIGSPGSDQRTSKILEKFYRQINNNHSFVWLHFAELDWICHTKSPESAESAQVLLELDRAIKEISSFFSHTTKNVNFLVFGDHGHVVVNQSVNIAEALSKASCKTPRDYVYFLDSTMARFWFNNDRSRREIKNVLLKLQNGRILTKAELTNYRCLFNNAKHFELVWVANGGTIISPNFWQGTESVKGMHGYLSEVIDNHSSFLLWGSRVKKSAVLNKNHKLIDIFPTLLDLLNFPIPATNEGVSILRD